MMTTPLSIFVSYHLCERLAQQGLTLNTWASWRECTTPGDANDVYLVAPGLDHDRLYSALDLPRGVAARIYRDTPAYTLADMLRCIPGFCLSQRDQNTTELAAFDIFQLAPITGDMSLPDACALMVLQMLDKKTILATQINDELLRNAIEP